LMVMAAFAFRAANMTNMGLFLGAGIVMFYFFTRPQVKEQFE